MSGKPDDVAPNSKQLINPGSRDRYMMRDVVRNMVANMEFVLNDLHGIMGDIQSLVVQIDSVTEKIDEQCGGCKKMASKQESSHVIRKPEAVDCQTYWSTRRNKGTNPSKILDKEEKRSDTSLTLATAPVLPITHESINQQHEQAKKLSNVERWLQQGKCFYKHSSLRQPIKRSKDSKSRDPSKRKSSNFEEIKLRETRNLSHLVMQPFPHQRTSPRVTFLDELPHCRKTNTKVSEFHSCVQPETRIYDSVYKATAFSNTSDDTYLEPVPYGGGKKQIQVFNAHYEEHTADESSLERSPSPFQWFKEETNLSSNEPNDKDIISQSNGGKTGQYEAHSASLPGSPFIQRRGGTSSMFSPYQGRSPGSIRRPQSRVSNTNTYQSLESDLDSSYDHTDPRCLTPDMDWSYLSLVGSDINRLDRSPGHVYQTIGSPVFRHRRSERQRGPNHFAFQTSPDVVGRLMTLEEGSNSSLGSRENSSDINDAVTTFDSSVVYNLENIVGSLVITHVYCNEVISPEGDEYCGYYEALVDAVLENIAGFETLQEACNHFDFSVGIVDDTYINFDDGFEEDEWAMSFKQQNDDYFEDDVDFNLLNIPGSQRSDDFSMKSADASAESNIRSTEIESSVGISDVAESKTRDGALRKPTNVRNNDNVAGLAMLPDGIPQYDDLDFKLSTRKSFIEEDSIAMRTFKEDRDGNFTLWSKPFPNEPTEVLVATPEDLIDGLDNIMTSSDEASCQAIGSRSGSSNMSFGSADMGFTSPEGDGLMTSSDADDLCTSQDERCQVSRAENSPEMPRSVSKSNMSKLRQEFFKSLYSACEKQDNENLRPERDIHTENPAPSETENEDKLTTAVTESSYSVDDSEIGLCPDDLTSYNRRLNTWTAYAMVHVSADDVSDSASDIINDNSITCSMTSSYFEADNNAAGSANQGFVDV